MVVAIDLSEQMILLDRCLESVIDTAQKSQQRKEHLATSAAYFLIGSFCSDGDIHVAHMAMCPLPWSSFLFSNITKRLQSGDALSKSLDDEWIADNAEKVTRILPGGIHIVGLAWFSDRSTYNLQKAMITRSLARIQRTTNLLTTLSINSVSDQMALIFVEPPAGKPTGLVIDVVRRGPDSPTKVSFSALDWIPVVSSASAKVCLNVPTRQKHSHFFTEFVAAIRPFAENLLSCPLSEWLLLFVFFRSYHQIQIRAAVPAKSNVGSAITAVKHHLIRSLTARAELQYESMDVVEEGSAAPCSVHQMPRPATTILYTHPAILLSDYLFEADTVEDAQKNFDELLGLKTSIEHIDEGWERSLEIEEMETIRAPLDDTPIANLRSKEDDNTHIFSLLIALSVIVGVVSIVVYFVMAK
ncbi:unnamed protein product [Haemonchus placei]|uniref:VWFA domain-containing protein n=1 Tax=Haemonchus placei TaxID=6290 RepID=A0A0N4WNG9_HAEPC|nr:unnamed protein product [Haemonchus placei]